MNQPVPTKSGMPSLDRDVERLTKFCERPDLAALLSGDAAAIRGAFKPTMFHLASVLANEKLAPKFIAQLPSKAQAHVRELSVLVREKLGAFLASPIAQEMRESLKEVDSKAETDTFDATPNAVSVAAFYLGANLEPHLRLNVTDGEGTSLAQFSMKWDDVPFIGEALTDQLFAEIERMRERAPLALRAANLSLVSERWKTYAEGVVALGALLESLAKDPAHSE